MDGEQWVAGEGEKELRQRKGRDERRLTTHAHAPSIQHPGHQLPKPAYFSIHPGREHPISGTFPGHPGRARHALLALTRPRAHRRTPHVCACCGPQRAVRSKHDVASVGGPRVTRPSAPAPAVMRRRLDVFRRDSNATHRAHHHHGCHSRVR